MLVLSRKPGESIQVAGNIVVRVLSTHGRKVRLGIEAPSDVAIWRSETADDFASSPHHQELPHADSVSVPASGR